uniref:Protein Shroom3-like n=2 Tax=Cynoglossus semilaevis TaxID=244447 RepID=A0A3P8UKL1_CYNSE
MESGCGRAGGGGGEGRFMLVEARLQGGAPWGFTVQGGLEHGEPLIISKVEEGGKADLVEHPLLVGDELIFINDIELTGYRQEAIALVKGSHKTLNLTVRREFDEGYSRESPAPPPSLPPSPPPPPLTPTHQQEATASSSSPSSSHHGRAGAGRGGAGGVQLRIKNRRSDPASRPHSWHSAKLGEGQRTLDLDDMESMSSGWHHNYHSSVSSTNLSSGINSGSGYLRKSPDQYSSRGSMESLDPPKSSQLHYGAQQHHSLGHHVHHSGPHPAYSSCHQLSSARSSNSIDHLHSKRDSAYSSFSTSSSIPEYLASTPSYSPERSYSMETVPQTGRGSAEIQQADLHYIRTVYDTQQGVPQEQELSSSSAASLRNNSGSKGDGGSRCGQSHDLQGVCYSSSSSGSSGSSSAGIALSHRHSVGPIWGPPVNHSSCESLKGVVPPPPRRSDSYTAIRNHERPNSWSSLEHGRPLRSIQKGSWHHSSGPVALGAAKGSYGPECQLHTVIEKSPESSPTTRPRQGGGFPQPPSSPESSSGSSAPAPQTGRLILPTSIYPVPQIEPHFAQMPNYNSGLGPSMVLPALVMENLQHQCPDPQRVSGSNDVGSEGQRSMKISAAENGQQANTSSSQGPQSLCSSSSSASAQTRTQTQEAHRLLQDDLEHCRHQIDRGGPPGQTGVHRPQNHKEPHTQSFKSSSSHRSHGHQDHVHQEQNHHPQTQSTHGPRPSWTQDCRESFKPAQSRGISVHSDSVAFSRTAQGQVPPNHPPVHTQPQAPPTSASQASLGHISDSALMQHQHQDHREQDIDRDHPLTRLEIALAEVQRCAGSDGVMTASSNGSSSFEDGSQGPTRSLSVLEKVSRFEGRESSRKRRSHSTSNAHHKSSHLRLNQMTDKGRHSPRGADDLRNMLERSTTGGKPHRTMSYRGSNSEYMKYRTPADPSSALQRSRSSFQLEESREGDGNIRSPRRQEVMASMQDISINRSYRDSIKDAQSRVLRSTSFRPRDCKSVSSLTAAPLSGSSSSSQQHPPASVKFPSLEKKGPKTMPKPQGVIIPLLVPPPVTSPHTPKERHVVSPPALPSVPAVGPPPLTRICGRKRLMAEQKKRSFSEPENLNEVGVSDSETTALFRRGGETSVADRRKMFELAASRVGGGAPQFATSKPELRQLQQDALAEYVERKRGGSREEGGQRTGPRPRSAYPGFSSHPGSSSYSDTLSLSSASSMISLHDSEQTVSSERRTSCTDLRNHQSNLFYPGRVTTPRPPAQPPHSALPESLPEILTTFPQDLISEAGLRRPSQSGSRDSGLGLQLHSNESPLSLGLSYKLNGALQRAGSHRGSGKSASSEDLLERAEEEQIPPQHQRSRSPPTVETNKKDCPPGDIRTSFVSDRGSCTLAENRPADPEVLENLSSQNSLKSIQSSEPSQDSGSPVSSSSYTPVSRRERQRNGERQRAHSTSTLAASVGLPCPWDQDGAVSEWQSSERLSLANMDAITFPETPQSSISDRTSSQVIDETPSAGRQTWRRLSEAGVLEETEKDVHRGRAYSLETRRLNTSEVNNICPVVPKSPPNMDVSVPPHSRDEEKSESSPSLSLPSFRHLSSLRISESSLFGSSEQQQPLETSTARSQQDFDEVFLQSPPPPSPPPPIKETCIIEDFPPPPASPPPPPPLLEMDEEHRYSSRESPSSELSNSSVPAPGSFLPFPPLPSLFFPSSPPPPPSPSFHPPPPPPPRTLSTINTYTTAEESLCLEYQPFPKQEKKPEELRMEELAQKLVVKDGSLAPLLDTWGSKSTVDLMTEIFPHSRSTDLSSWQHMSSGQLGHRIRDVLCDSGEKMEEKTDINSLKVELCEALSSSVEALQKEKEQLSEEQRRHQVLGSNIEALVQDQLRSNEREKYSMFIGDLEKIVNLLLSLCSRLSRINRSLMVLEKEELTEEEAMEEKVRHSGSN